MRSAAHAPTDYCTEVVCITTLDDFSTDPPEPNTAVKMVEESRKEVVNKHNFSARNINPHAFRPSLSSGFLGQRIEQKVSFYFCSLSLVEVGLSRLPA